MILKPRDRFRDAVAQAMRSVESKELLGSSDVQAASRLPVWLRRVPHNVTSKTDVACYKHCEFSDRNLLSASEIHGISSVIVFHRKQNRFRGILHVEELSRGRSIAPQDNLAQPAVLCSIHLRIMAGIT